MIQKTAETFLKNNEIPLPNPSKILRPFLRVLPRSRSDRFCVSTATNPARIPATNPTTDPATLIRSGLPRDPSATIQKNIAPRLIRVNPRHPYCRQAIDPRLALIF